MRDLGQHKTAQNKLIPSQEVRIESTTSLKPLSIILTYWREHLGHPGYRHPAPAGLPTPMVRPWSRNSNTRSMPLPNTSPLPCLPLHHSNFKQHSPHPEQDTLEWRNHFEEKGFSILAIIGIWQMLNLKILKIYQKFRVGEVVKRTGTLVLLVGM